MTYDVFGGTLNLTRSIIRFAESIDLDLPGSDLAETMWDVEGVKLAARISYNSMIDNRSRQPVFSLLCVMSTGVMSHHIGHA